jgi:hypothetical protein
MDVREDLLRCLLDGLPYGDQADVLDLIQGAQAQQLEEKRHPRRRRRRNAEGVLIPPPD